jgi:hypothetical protein
MANDLRTLSALETEICGDYFSIDSKHIKGYKSVDALMKALKNLGASREYGRPLVVCKSDGRFTALISATTLGGNMTAFPGFMKV